MGLSFVNELPEDFGLQEGKGNAYLLLQPTVNLSLQCQEPVCSPAVKDTHTGKIDIKWLIFGAVGLPNGKKHGRGHLVAKLLESPRFHKEMVL